MINLNHLNLTLEDIPAARDFFETYFDFTSADRKPNDTLSVLAGSNGFVLVLMNERMNEQGNSVYPDNFHIGFYLTDQAAVDAMHQKLKAGGISVEQLPQRMRKTYGFYFKLQRILIEVTTEVE
jgi:catechol 2,3-dioxygenase-like lactoylglutathione lyase family enzyme